MPALHLAKPRVERSLTVSERLRGVSITMKSRQNPWIVRRVPRDSAAVRLFCVPHAGAGSVIYRDWFTAFPESIDVCVIEPPGRLARRREPAPTDIPQFTSAFSAALEDYLDVPFAFFGYSLGALMAFECARALRRDKQREPQALIVAAHKAPQLPLKLPPISQQSKPLFVNELERRYGPLEPAIKSEPELLDAVVDIMRVDLGMLERYQHQPEAPFSCPIVAIGGTEDTSLDAEALQAWQAHTSGAFRTEWIPGGHFFLRQHPQKLRALIQAELTRTAL